MSVHMTANYDMENRKTMRNPSTPTITHEDTIAMTSASEQVCPCHDHTCLYAHPSDYSVFLPNASSATQVHDCVQDYSACPRHDAGTCNVEYIIVLERACKLVSARHQQPSAKLHTDMSGWDVA